MGTDAEAYSGSLLAGIGDDLHISAVSRQVDQRNFKIFMPSIYFKPDVVVSL